jgi:murein DD-endopeptidase MepM/ murein hydrolase activator NlpD
LIQHNTQSCIEEECKKFNNYITIMHDDGSFAIYNHIKHNGGLVKIGDVVKKGDIIALSGNVGYSNGPHLHFECFKAGSNGKITLETKFRINEGKVALLLKEGEVYYRKY